MKMRGNEFSLCYPKLFIIIVLLIGHSQTKEETPENLSSAQVLSTADCVGHLVRFGYLERDDLPQIWYPGISIGADKNGNGADNDRIFPEKLRNAIIDFQTYAGLEITGRFDDATKLKILSPRCGNPDKNRDSRSPPPENSTLIVNNNATFRFQLMAGAPRWKKQTLTYKMIRYSDSGISPIQVDREIDSAFQYWQRETNLNFVRSTASVVDIEILFSRRYHKDDYPFDGKNGVLAHAFGPTTYDGGIGGDLHFDDEEPWSTGNQKGTSLLQVAVHEIGHSLGLSHSNVRNAVMYAYMEPQSNDKFRLHKDDIAGIQYLYGERNPEINTVASAVISETVATVSPKPEVRPDLCLDPMVDAITTIDDTGNIYVFKGAYYFVLDKNGAGIIANSTNRIDATFKGLPSSVDAAVRSGTSGRTYFFKGKYYWRFNGFQADGSGAPILIRDGFPGVPDDVNAAFVWSGNQKLYFFKGSKYWMYDPDKIPPVDIKYPLDISSWRGLPNDIDAAFLAPHGKTFFFKGGQYWRYDDSKFAVSDAQPSYPRSSRLMWFGCHKYRPDIQDVLVNHIYKI